MSKRSRYAEIGQRAVQHLAEHLRKKGCDVQIMNGTYGQPDLLWDVFAVEVKHVQFLYKQKKGDTYYASYGDLKCDKEAWRRLCEWCEQHDYVPCLIAVTEISTKVRLFLFFSHCLVEEMMKWNEPAKWLHVPAWEMLMLGEIIRL